MGSPNNRSPTPKPNHLNMQNKLHWELGSWMQPNKIYSMYPNHLYGSNPIVIAYQWMIRLKNNWRKYRQNIRRLDQFISNLFMFTSLIILLGTIMPLILASSIFRRRRLLLNYIYLLGNRYRFISLCCQLKLNMESISHCKIISGLSLLGHRMKYPTKALSWQMYRNLFYFYPNLCILFQYFSSPSLSIRNVSSLIWQMVSLCYTGIRYLFTHSDPNNKRSIGYDAKGFSNSN